MASDRIHFTLALGRALHQAGYATNQLEELLLQTSRRLGIEGQFFTTPTSIFASFGRDADQRTFMIRTEPRPPDLGRLVRATDVARAVLQGEMTPAEGQARLADQSSATPALAIVAAYGLASATAANFLGGGWTEAWVAALAGLVTGVLAVGAARWTALARIFEPLAAFVCGLGIAVVAGAAGTCSVPIATLAGLIVLIPGLTLTSAIAELATGHLAAGTARMASAFMTFIGVGFGVAMGYRVAALAGHAIGLVTPIPPPGWTMGAALVGAAVAFAVLLRAERRDLPWIVAASTVAFLTTRAGAQLLSPELGAFFGAFAVSLGSDVYNRITNRPAAVTLVPGLLVLVPGSIGFRSITALLESRVVSGIETAFDMMLTAVALVAGLLFAAALVRERPVTGDW